MGQNEKCYEGLGLYEKNILESSSPMESMFRNKRFMLDEMLQILPKKLHDMKNKNMTGLQ